MTALRLGADRLGRGLKLATWRDTAGTLRRSPRISTTGGLAESTGPSRVEESIRTILGTRPGERPMRPDFGCDLAGLVFAPHDAATTNLCRYRVGDALARWEPRIELLDVDVRQDVGARREGLLLIGVHYRILSTGEDRELALRFPTEPGPR